MSQTFFPLKNSLASHNNNHKFQKILLLKPEQFSWSKVTLRFSISTGNANSSCTAVRPWGTVLCTVRLEKWNSNTNYIPHCPPPALFRRFKSYFHSTVNFVLLYLEIILGSRRQTEKVKLNHIKSFKVVKSSHRANSKSKA